jgi:hypothetical protein
VYLWLFTHIFTGILIVKGITARRLYKSFGVEGLIGLTLNIYVQDHADLEDRNSFSEIRLLLPARMNTERGGSGIHFIHVSSLFLFVGALYFKIRFNIVNCTNSNASRYRF